MFNSPEGNLEDIFVTDYNVIDQYSKTGTLWGWGNNYDGQLGTNDTIYKSSPVQTIAGGTNWKTVSCGKHHNAAIKTDGTLWTWGYNGNGELGINDTINKSSPVQTIAGGTNWKSVSCGKNHIAAIKTDGTLWLWGWNFRTGDRLTGELGNNEYGSRSSPVQTVAGGTNWKLVNAGMYRTAAIKTDGTLWLWGNNEDGELGTNDRINKSSPVQTIAGGTNWKSVSGGEWHTAAIKTDGTLWLWGWNGYGQLGTNDSISRSSPVQTIAGGTNWKSVSSGVYHIAAIKTDGTLWGWGWNGDGELGTNDSISRSSPVQTIAGGTNWKSVDGGAYHIAAIKTDGTLWGWGYNNYGRLGTNDTIYRSSPVQTIAGGTNWKLVSGGNYHTAAITFDY